MDDSNHSEGGRGKSKKAAPKKSAPKGVYKAGELNRAAERLKQVSDPTRLRVLMALAGEPRNVTQLRDELGGISQPALSHHLALLRHGRLIEPSRQGKTNVYDLTNSGRELADVVNKLIP
jgi:DNA-binding transcriptional ArsR family regulator